MDGARIMIVEDNTTVAEECRECLEGFGFRVTSIQVSGDDAVLNAERERPAAVLMAARLRGEPDGIEAAGRIYDRFDIPVVFLSACSDDDLLRRAGQVGSFGYLVRPFNPRELYTLLETAIYKAKTERERRSMESRLRQIQKMEAVGRLAGGVAHDLNNMLSIILGYTQSAMDEIDPAASAHQDLDEVLEAAHRSSGLVKQLLTFARRQILTPKVLDLNKEVDTNVNRLGRLIGDTVELVWRPGDVVWSLKMDPSQIDQILTQLCLNAKDAVSAGGRIMITTGMSSVDSMADREHEGAPPGDYLLLTISDNGRGLEPERLKNLFDPFSVSKEFDEQRGPGMAVIHGIVRQNNGFIKVHSDPGQGSTFNIYLPRYLSEKDRQPAAKPLEKSLPQAVKTILLVEDEPAILKLTAMMLKRQGYAVLTATTAEEAIRLARAHAGEIHLVMTDIVMPKMNGRDLVRRLHAHFPGLKSLYMSGYSADAVLKQGFLEDHIHFIQKPFTQRELALKVREALSAPEKEPQDADAAVEALHGDDR